MIYSPSNSLLPFSRTLSKTHHHLLRTPLQSSRTRVFTSFAPCHHHHHHHHHHHYNPARRRSLPALCYTLLTPRPLRTSFKLADALQTRDHSGHDHHGHSHSHSHGFGHHHHHDPNPFLTSRDKTDPGVRITRVGLYVNIVMVITKGVGGWVFNSQALVADAFHALTDMVSDIMTLATVTFALRPPTDRFPQGYGKIESLGSLGVSSLLLFGGMAMGYGSLVHLIGDFAPTFSHFLPHVHAHEHSHGIPNLNAAWLALASIGAKEWLYRKTMKIALEKKSSVLASNAVHHRVDSLTAIVALVAIAGSNVFPSASWLDPVGGLLVAMMVVQAGAANTRSALEELADAGIDGEVKTEVIQKVAGVGEDVVAVDGIKSGQNYLLTITVAVEGWKTLAELEEVEERVRSSVASMGGMWRVQVRFVKKGGEIQGEFVKLNKKDD